VTDEGNWAPSPKSSSSVRGGDSQRDDNRILPYEEGGIQNVTDNNLQVNVDILLGHIFNMSHQMSNLDHWEPT
jgi:hypothetical protein